VTSRRVASARPGARVALGGLGALASSALACATAAAPAPAPASPAPAPVASAPAATPAPAAPAAAVEEARALFDGKTLDGWETTGSAVWRVEEGVIVGTQDGDPKRGGMLATRETFQDFELELEFLIDEHGKYNSGIYLRNKRGARGRTGYQVNIGRGAAGEYCGGVYTDRWLAKGDEADTIRKPREWNHIWIRAQGPRIEVKLNGQRIVDLEDPAPKPEHLEPGVIAFQTYGAEGHAGFVKFRHVRVRPIGGR
jgi:hypothetical protein